MITTRKHGALSIALVTSILAAPLALADAPGVYANRIVVGQSAAFDGPAQALGLGMRQGLQAAFSEANEQGGVHGRKVELVHYDDGYEPEQAIKNTHKLIDVDKVFALIGAVGTPTAKATQPIAKASNVPYVGPFTGAGFLRKPDNTHVVNVRGTYDQETEAWIKHLTDDLGSERIAILYQDDSFGRAGLSGVQKALSSRNLSLVAEGTYQRNTVAVKTALLTIRKAKPDAVVMVGSYKPIAEFVKLAKKLKMDSQFVTISFVGSKALAQELGSDGAGVVVTQVVPFYQDRSLPVVDSYQTALQKFDESAIPGFVSLEGYITGKLFLSALEKAGPNLNRDTFIETFQSQRVKFNLGGVTLSYGPGDNQGMDDVFLSVIQSDGSYRYTENLKRAIDTAELPD